MDLTQLTTKQMIHGSEARQLIKSGVQKLANAVKVTLGPRGRNVVIDREHSAPIITKDGVTVANEIKLKNKYENMGAQLVKEVSKNTANAAGDGTTSSAVLAEAIYSEGLRSVENGSSPIEIKRGIDLAVEGIRKKLDTISYPTSSTTEIAHVGAISANNEMWIGDLIADAMDQVGKEGLITVQDGKSPETYVEITDGLRFYNGYMLDTSITDRDRLIGEYEDVSVICYNDKIMSLSVLGKMLKELSKDPAKLKEYPILLIADAFGADVLKTIETNNLAGTFLIIPVKSFGVGGQKGEMLEDVAILTNGKTVKHRDVSEVSWEVVGTANSVVITAEHTTLLGNGDPERIKARVRTLKAMKDKAPTEFDKEFFNERIARLAGGIAVIYAGGRSEAEIIELRHRIEDALGATQAAVAEGVVPGGGTALAKIAYKLHIPEDIHPDQKLGYEIVKRACYSPLRQILENAGFEPVLITKQVVESGDWFDGYDAKAGELTNMLERGIIDPTKVTKLAISNAASVSGLLLTTEVMITGEDDV